jgi:hypothetical protein
MSQAPTFGQGLEVAGIVMKAIASAAKKSNFDSDQVQNKIVGKPGAIFDFFDGLFAEKLENKPTAPILKLLSHSENLIIEALDGKEFICGDRKVFKSYISDDFKNLKLNQVSEATKEISVQVHELVEDATFAKIFTSLSSDLDKLCLTQHQIKRFCVKYPNQLSRNGVTFFLFKLNGEYFVAGVHVGSGGLGVCVDRFGRGVLWGAEYCLRIVVPQL